MPPVIFPTMGNAIRQGTVLNWLKEIGSTVEEGEELVEIAMEKVVTVVIADSSGTLRAVFAPPGAVLGEGEPLGWVGSVEEEVPELKINLCGWDTEISPIPDDVDPAAWERGKQPAQPLPVTEGKSGKSARGFLKNSLRESTAIRLAKSWSAPKVDLFCEVDFSAVQTHRASLKTEGVEPPSFNVYFALAVTRAFGEFPQLNGHWVDGSFKPLEKTHIGVAVALDQGLLTLSIRDTQKASLMEIHKQFKSLVRKALGMKLTRNEMYGSSLTVTNLGEYGLTTFTPILNPPEIFILGIGALEERPVVRDGKVAIAPLSTFCLSFDHRAVDGAPAADFFRRIKWHLENIS